jgi:DNA replication protein DnaC
LLAAGVPYTRIDAILAARRKSIREVGIGPELAAITPPKRLKQQPPPPPPDWALALRQAARMRPVAEHESFPAQVSRCVDALHQQLGERYSPARASLESYKTEDDSGRQAAAVKLVKRFIADLENALREGSGLVLYGSVGTGKDHLLAAALYRVAGAAIPVAWASGETIFAGIRDTMDSGELEQKIVGPLISPVVLAISDPTSPRGPLSDWDARILARIVDKRNRAMRCTWLTMNAENEADAKNRLTPLIWDRLRDQAEIIPCFWESFRGRRIKATAPPIAGKVAS